MQFYSILHLNYRIPVTKKKAPLKILWKPISHRLWLRLWFSRSQWRIREYFGRKSTFFLIRGSKDSPCSWDHFHTKLLVVGGRYVGVIVNTINSEIIAPCCRNFTLQIFEFEPKYHVIGSCDEKIDTTTELFEYEIAPKEVYKYNESFSAIIALRFIFLW